MAKKKDEETDVNKIGSMMKGKMTQRERNLKVKREMIEKGEREESKTPPNATVHERNLALKKELREADEFLEKEAEKIDEDEDNGKGKSRRSK